MKENEIKELIKSWSDDNSINSYAYYVLTHDDNFYKEKMAILTDCKDEEELYAVASTMFE